MLTLRKNEINYENEKRPSMNAKENASKPSILTILSSVVFSILNKKFFGTKFCYLIFKIHMNTFYFMSI